MTESIATGAVRDIPLVYGTSYITVVVCVVLLVRNEPSGLAPSLNEMDLPAIE